MSDALATRCSACGTVFRVVPDQLRVSDGWVRCGRCAEVFNAAQSLLDAQTGEPRSGYEAVPPGVAVEPVAAPSAAPVTAPVTAPVGAPVATFTPSFVPQPDRVPESAFEKTQVLFPPDEVAPEAVIVPAAESALDLDFGETDSAALDGDADADASAAALVAYAADSFETPSVFDPAERSFDVEAMIDSSIERQPSIFTEPPLADISAADPLRGTPLPISALDDTPPARQDPPFAPADTFSATPSFVRRAERAERWRRPGVRAALLAGVLLGLLGLAAQVAYVYRDLMAARMAFTRPLLENSCAFIGCTVGPARVIDGLTVESSGLLRVAESNAYRFSVALRNRTGIDLALPAVDLRLTDSQGKLLARRVLLASELGADRSALAAGRDLLLQATLRSTTEAVAGYTIELFYP